MLIKGTERPKNYNAAIIYSWEVGFWIPKLIGIDVFFFFF